MRRAIGSRMAATCFCAALSICATLACAALVACVPAGGPIPVVLDESFSSLAPGLAARLRSGGATFPSLEKAFKSSGSAVVVSSPLSARAWIDSRPAVSMEGGATLVVPFGEALGSAAPGTGGGPAGMVIAGYDSGKAYREAGRAAGRFVARTLAADRAAGGTMEGAKARCLFLFAPGPFRLPDLASGFRAAYEAAGAPAESLASREMGSGDKAAADPEGELRAAYSSEDSGALRIVFVAADNPGFAARLASEKPGLAVGIDLGILPGGTVKGTRISFVIAGDEVSLARAVLSAARAEAGAAARKSRDGSAGADSGMDPRKPVRVPARVTVMPDARRIRAGNARLSSLFR